MLRTIMSLLQNRLIWIVLILGVLIRILYFQKFGIMLFQHDWHGHIELIKYMAENRDIPAIPNKGWEYPQQSLYYIITATLYAVSSSWGFSEQEALYGLGYFSLFCSFIFLIYGYRLLQLLTSSRWVQTVSMTFLALTPSLVYMSARINNDVLVMALSSMALFYTVRSYQHGFQKGFYIALLSVSLLFLTKVSSASIELFLFALLLISYFQVKQSELKLLKKQLFIYGLVGVFLLSMTLWRLYVPLEESFYMVNSTEFPKQTLEVLDSSYFGTFHFYDLITAGQSHVFGEDSVRHSFLTYQYGTMFFGEFDYAFFWNKTEFLPIVMQGMLLFGLLYIMGFIGYLIHFFKEKMVNKILFGVLLINLMLILKFIFSYPSVCNTDFRYFVSSFIIFALVFAQGLYYLSSYYKIIRDVFTMLVVGLVLIELLFFYGLMM
ncbi:MAG: glycosyltransferase family 39 protein [Epsilonproteobacteria bacterium]|nr:glycosyltransferase family 39 protein [Campylobacterota bacterium]